MNSIYTHRNRAVLDDENTSKVSRRLRDLEFKSISSYEKPELVPVEKKDVQASFTLSKYINDLEKNLTDLAVALEPKLQEVIQNISDDPSTFTPITSGKYMPPAQVRGVFGSGITEQNTVSRIISSWNAFTTYLKNFRDVNEMSRADSAELFEMLVNLRPLIEKNINDILIIEQNDPKQKFNYEKVVLEKIDEKIDSRNLTKIEIRDLPISRRDFDDTTYMLDEKGNEYRELANQYGETLADIDGEIQMATQDLDILEQEFDQFKADDKKAKYEKYQQEVDQRNQEIADAEAENQQIDLRNNANPPPATLEAYVKVPAKLPPKTFRATTSKFPKLLQYKQAQSRLNDLLEGREETEKEGNERMIKVDEEFKKYRKQLTGGENFREKIIRKEERIRRGVVPEKMIHYRSELDDYYKD